MKRTLNDIMEIDSVVRVDAHGNVTDSDVYAPSVYDDGPETVIDQAPDGVWSLMSGYSGQYGYAGPVMHPSEYIGGGMERDILATPGLYVATVVYDINDTDNDDNATGWVVAYREEA